MFSTLKTVAMATVAAGALALAGAAGAQANATSFDVGTHLNPTGQTGSMPVSATAGASRLSVNNGAAVLNCLTTYAEGTANTGNFAWTGATSGTQVVGNVVPKFGDCTGPAGLEFQVDCHNPSAGGTTDLAVTDIPTPFAGTVGGEIVNIECDILFPLIACTAVVQGSVQGSFENAVTPSTPSTITVFTAGQNLNVVSSGCPTFIPTGSASYGEPVGSGSAVADIVYAFDGAMADQPVITPTS